MYRDLIGLATAALRFDSPSTPVSIGKAMQRPRSDWYSAAVAKHLKVIFLVCLKQYNQ